MNNVKLAWELFTPLVFLIGLIGFGMRTKPEKNWFYFSIFASLFFVVTAFWGIYFLIY